jgi:hypothetical protein
MCSDGSTAVSRDSEPGHTCVNAAVEFGRITLSETRFPRPQASSKLNIDGFTAS